LDSKWIPQNNNPIWRKRKEGNRDMLKSRIKSICFYPEARAYNRNGKTYFINSKAGTWVVLSSGAINQLINGSPSSEEFARVYDALAKKYIIKDKRYPYQTKQGTIKPLLIKFQLTGKCNFHCVYCFNDSAIRTHSMNNETLYQSIDYVFDNPYAANGISFALYGGEPFMDKALFYKAVQYIQEKSQGRSDVQISTVTNGSLLNDDDISFIENNHIHLSYSFDGLPEFQAHNRIPNSMESMESPLLHLKKIASYKYTTILSTITREMSAHLEDIALYMENLGVTNVEFLPLRLIGTAEGKNDLSVNIGEYVRSLIKVVDLIESGKIQHLRVGAIMRLLLPLETGDTLHGGLQDYRCGAGRNVLYIKYDGTIQGCDMIPDKYSPVLGDIWKGIDKLDKLDATIAQINKFSDSCKQCPWFYFCRSGCTGASGSDEVSCNQKHSLSCAIGKTMYPLLLEKLLTDGGVMHHYFVTHFPEDMKIEAASSLLT